MTLIDFTPTVASNPRLDSLPVAIIGAGPIGLAAAANLVERRIPFEIYEAGTSAAASVSSWGHVRLFSPWKHLIDPAARRLLEPSGWIAPADDVAPTGAQLVADYLAPLASLDAIAAHLHTGTRVTDVSHEGLDRTRSVSRAATPYLLRLLETDGTITEVSARAVIDASGTYGSPNSLGSNGLPVLGYASVADRVTHALPDVRGRDRARFAGKRVAVVGAGHSAANTLIALAQLSRDEPGTSISWVIRNGSAARVTASANDELPGRASLGARVERLVTSGTVEVVDGFELRRLEDVDGAVRLVGDRNGAPETLDVDIVVNATGFRPDLGMLREIRLDLDEVVEAPRRLAPLIDPNLHSCGTVEPHGFAELSHPDTGFFIAGMKSYGRAPTFLLATGYEQVRSIVAWLDRDVAAATRMELRLPSTGVCSTDAAPGASCC
jgi:thioredoxin reductase